MPDHNQQLKKVTLNDLDDLDPFNAGKLFGVFPKVPLFSTEHPPRPLPSNPSHFEIELKIRGFVLIYYLRPGRLLWLHGSSAGITEKPPSLILKMGLGGVQCSTGTLCEITFCSEKLGIQSIFIVC